MQKYPNYRNLGPLTLRGRSAPISPLPHTFQVPSPMHHQARRLEPYISFSHLSFSLSLYS